MSDVRRDAPVLRQRKKGVEGTQKKEQDVADHLAVPGATEKQKTNFRCRSLKKQTSKKAKKELPMSGIEIAAVDSKGNFSGQTGANENLSDTKISTTDPAPACSKLLQGVEEESLSTMDCSVQYRASKGSGLSDLGLGFDALVRDGAFGPRGGSGDGGNTNEVKAKSPKPSYRDVVTAQPGTSRYTPTRNETVAVQVETPNVTPACGEVAFQPTMLYNNNFAVQPRTSGMVARHRPQAPVHPGPPWTNPSRNNGGAVQPGIVPPSPNFNNCPVQPGTWGMAFEYPPPGAAQPGTSWTNPSRNNRGAFQPGIVPPSPNFNNFSVQPGPWDMAFDYPPPGAVRLGTFWAIPSLNGYMLQRGTARSLSNFNNFQVQRGTWGMAHVPDYPPPAPVRPGTSWTNHSRNNVGAVQRGTTRGLPNFNNFQVQRGAWGMAHVPHYPPPAAVEIGRSWTNPSRSNGGGIQPGSSLATRPYVNTDQPVNSSLPGTSRRDDSPVWNEEQERRIASLFVRGLNELLIRRNSYGRNGFTKPARRRN